ncbi:putative acetyltransferase At3g50280 [Bidens hawaiensis]|uniref:putative acetyltransferase At3g50280 n=1 Tax=Bidens hawaiensis TaxID=980011 RepID=UPI00404AC51C
MTSQKVRRVSECFVKPQHNLSQDAKQPIYFTPYELTLLNVTYSQKGLLFTKPPENQDFSVTAFLDDLRRSLSATLTHFYPLAARLATRKQDNPPSHVIYIDPENSPGVKFIHATVDDDVTVSDVLTSPNVPSVVHSFFDLNDAINHDGHTLPLLSIQVTELTDGIFIGGSVNHLLADGTSFWHFMASWSEVFRSKDENEYISISRPPILKRWILEGYDPITKLPFSHQDDQFIERSEKQQVRERFFHFSSAAVSKLKAIANDECNTQKISSLQAVSALLWRCVTRVRHQPDNSETVCRLVVSNRRRVNPPLSDDYFGSPVGVVMGTATVGDLMARGLGWAALKIHEAVTNYDDAEVKKWVESWYRNPIVNKLNKVFHPNTTHIGSSPRFDMYGCEFGLGKAVAARSGFANKADGKLTMYPGREGSGSMDVEVCLLPEYMMDLQCNEEFINATKI